MDFIRFSGELFIYYVLIALGGGVLTAFMMLIFQAAGINAEPFFTSWLLPCGAMGASDRRRLAGGGQAGPSSRTGPPVLARLFTPPRSRSS